MVDWLKVTSSEKFVVEEAGDVEDDTLFKFHVNTKIYAIGTTCSFNYNYNFDTEVIINVKASLVPN
jgi:hypothetical protein